VTGKQKVLHDVLVRVQSALEKADPELARSLLAEPPRRPDEPFGLEYIDRLMRALQERVDCGDLRRHPELPLLPKMIRTLRRLRAAAEEGR